MHGVEQLCELRFVLIGLVAVTVGAHAVQMIRLSGELLDRFGVRAGDLTWFDHCRQSLHQTTIITVFAIGRVRSVISLGSNGQNSRLGDGGHGMRMRGTSAFGARLRCRGLP